MSLMLGVILFQQSAWLEADYQSCACAGMEMEVRLPGGARADCVSDTHATEVESYSDWAEGIGQALHYGAETGKTPQLIMFCKTDDCLKESLRLESTIAAFDLPIEVVDAAELGCEPDTSSDQR